MLVGGSLAALAAPDKSDFHLFGAAVAAAVRAEEILLAARHLLAGLAAQGQLPAAELRALNRAAVAEPLPQVQLRARAAQAKSSSLSSPAKERSCQLSL